MDADFAGLWSFEGDCLCKVKNWICPYVRRMFLIFKPKLQTEIALSTLEAEYIALSQSMRELLPLRNLLQEVGKNLKLDFVKHGLM